MDSLVANTREAAAVFQLINCSIIKMLHRVFATVEVNQCPRTINLSIMSNNRLLSDGRFDSKVKESRKLAQIVLNTQEQLRM